MMDIFDDCPHGDGDEFRTATIEWAGRRFQLTGVTGSIGVLDGEGYIEIAGDIESTEHTDDDGTEIEVKKGRPDDAICYLPSTGYMTEEEAREYLGLDGGDDA